MAHEIFNQKERPKIEPKIQNLLQMFNKYGERKNFWRDRGSYERIFAC